MFNSHIDKLRRFHSPGKTPEKNSILCDPQINLTLSRLLRDHQRRFRAAGARRRAARRRPRERVGYIPTPPRSERFAHRKPHAGVVKRKLLAPYFLHILFVQTCVLFYVF